MEHFKIHRIKNKEDPHFAEFWKIYSSSFPLSERRNPDQQTSIFKNQDYQLEVYLLDNHAIGFIAHWKAKEFVFIEHFAIASEVRNKGFGNAILKEFIEGNIVPVILEIEPPMDDLTRRRLKFYEYLGFIWNDHLHYQPPYHPEDQPLKFEILTYPNQISTNLYFQFSQFQKNTVME